MMPRSFIWHRNMAQLYVDETSGDRKPPKLDQLNQMASVKARYLQ